MYVDLLVLQDLVRCKKYRQILNLYLPDDGLEVDLIRTYLIFNL